LYTGVANPSTAMASLPERHETLVQWCQAEGAKMEKVKLKYTEGSGVGVVATDAIKVTTHCPSLCSSNLT